MKSCKKAGLVCYAAGYILVACCDVGKKHIYVNRFLDGMVVMVR